MAFIKPHDSRIPIISTFIDKTLNYLYTWRKDGSEYYDEKIFVGTSKFAFEQLYCAKTSPFK